MTDPLLIFAAMSLPQPLRDRTDRKAEQDFYDQFATDGMPRLSQLWGRIQAQISPPGRRYRKDRQDNPIGQRCDLVCEMRLR